MESNCCGALPIGETHDNLGFCSECREHAVFKETPEDAGNFKTEPAISCDLSCGLAMAELND